MAGLDETYSLADLRRMIGEALEPTIQMRRSGKLSDDDDAEVPSGPVTEAEIDEFIEVNPLFEPWVVEELLDPGLIGFRHKRATLSEEGLDEFEGALSWAEVQDWYAGDDSIGGIHVMLNRGLFEFSEPDRHSIIRPPAGYSGHFSASPSMIALGRQLIDNGHSLYNLEPRQFEELIADLLDRDGWKVILTPQSRDGGVDVIAERRDPLLGLVRTIWEAKRYHPNDHKVGVSKIRELAASVEDNRGTKGILATTGLLTKGALEYVEQRKHRLSAAEFAQMEDWLFGRISLG